MMSTESKLSYLFLVWPYHEVLLALINTAVLKEGEIRQVKSSQVLFSGLSALGNFTQPSDSFTQTFYSILYSLRQFRSLGPLLI